MRTSSVAGARWPVGARYLLALMLLAGACGVAPAADTGNPLWVVQGGDRHFGASERYICSEAELVRLVATGTFAASADPPRAQLERILKTTLADIDSACHLDGSQKQRLELAGRGDVSRFFEQLDGLFRRLQAARADDVELKSVFEDVMRDVPPIREALALGVFGDDSLLAKARGSVLSTAQAGQYERFVREQRAQRHRARIAKAVAYLDGPIGFGGEQRQAFQDVLFAELPLDDRRLALVAVPVDDDGCQIVLDRIGRLPREKLQPLFAEGQWRRLESQFLLAGLGWEQAKRVDETRRATALVELYGDDGLQPALHQLTGGLLLEIRRAREPVAPDAQRN